MYPRSKATVSADLIDERSLLAHAQRRSESDVCVLLLRVSVMRHYVIVLLNRPCIRSEMYYHPMDTLLFLRLATKCRRKNVFFLN